MEALASWIVGILMLTLPVEWAAPTPPACRDVPVIHAPPGTKTQECSATFARGDSQLTVIVWKPVVARDGGPMASVEEQKAKLLGKDVIVRRTSQFMGVPQEVLVTSLALESPPAQILIYAKKTSAKDFQAVLDRVKLAK